MDGIDKMLVPIGGRPMLAWTLEALAASPVVERMVVVASAGNIAEISGAPWLPDRVDRVVVGGDRRQASVAAGVDALGERPDRDDAADRVILVHDGARPLVSARLDRIGRASGRAARGGDPGHAGRRDRQAGGGRDGRRRPSTAPTW